MAFLKAIEVQHMGKVYYNWIAKTEPFWGKEYEHRNIKCLYACVIITVKTLNLMGFLFSFLFLFCFISCHFEQCAGYQQLIKMISSRASHLFTLLEPMVSLYVYDTNFPNFSLKTRSVVNYLKFFFRCLKFQNYITIFL